MELRGSEGFAGSQHGQLRPLMPCAGSYDHTCKIWDIRNKQVSPWLMIVGLPDQRYMGQLPVLPDCQTSNPKMSFLLHLHITLCVANTAGPESLY